MTFDNYKFRCSGLGNLLIDPRSKSDTLSETTKTYLRAVWIAEVYGREKFITTKYMDKGISVESDSLELASKHLGKTYFKNLKQLENEYIKGTPDVIDTDCILDVKSSWDIWTFAGVTEDIAKKTYIGQLTGYMWLADKQEAMLAYCLVNTPEDQISYEMYKLKANGSIIDTQEDEDRARINYIFDDIPSQYRIKMYSFVLELEIKIKLIERINAAREYMNSLTL